IPKPPFDPLAAKGWKPSASQLRSWGDKNEIATGGVKSFIDHIDNGTLTSDHVAAMTACYPTNLMAIQVHLTAEAMNPDTKWLNDPNKRAQASMVLGHPLAQSMLGLPATAVPPMPAPQQSGGGKQAKAPKKTFMSEEATASQEARSG